jgi:hypothetical protein
MGDVKTWSFNSVRLPVLKGALKNAGLDWEKCNHIAATSSLSGAINSTDASALSIKTLIDIIVMDGLSSERRLSIDSFPQFDALNELSANERKEKITSWNHQVQGRRSRLSIEMQQRVRDYLATSSITIPIQKVLKKGRRELLKSIQSLIEIGVNPEHLVCVEEVSKASRDIWIDLEKEFPDFCSIRRDLWIDAEEFQIGTSRLAVSLKQRIKDALGQAFGPCDGKRTIIHHGFYFYTAPQWALFQLIREMDDIDQVFIVHDDGSSPVYESWRWFFTAKWNMTDAEFKGGEVSLNSPAIAFMNSLRGKTIDSSLLHGSLKVFEFSTPATFVRDWLKDVEALAAIDGERRVKLFAADKDLINRHIGRFAGFAQDADVDLALLPLGAYLYGLHKCIDLSQDGKVVVNLNGETLRDIVASGYLVERKGTPVPASLAPALIKSLPFFDDCVSGDAWIKRASDLHKLLLSEVAILGGRTKGESTLERMGRISSNELRLAPWVDITPTEALDIQHAIEAVVQFAGNVAKEEKVKLNQHLGTLRDEILRGMQFLSPTTRERIEVIISEMKLSNDTDVAVDDLLEIVGLILAPPVDFRDEDRNPWGEADLVGDLNQMDVLGLIRHDGPLHVANLSDISFPSTAQTVLWPFSLDDLQRSPNAVDAVALEITQTRQATSSLAALYLTSLALDGVEPDNWVKLSFIKAGEREERNQSPILALVTSFSEKQIRSESVRQCTGGVDLQRIDSGHIGNMVRTRRSPRPPRASDAVITESIKKSGSIPASSALACPRRFATQWVAGPSPAFQSEHHHSMLYGNLFGRKLGIKVLVNDLFRQVTKGQRASSEAKAAVKPGGAHQAWIFTLGGRGGGIDPVSKAYQSADADKLPSVDDVAPKLNVFLPQAHEDSKNDVCKDCPIKPRCAVWRTPDKSRN